MLSDDLTSLAACVAAAAGQTNQTLDGVRRFLRACAVNLEAAADRAAAMEACYQQDIDDAVQLAPNVVPFRRTGVGR